MVQSADLRYVEGNRWQAIMGYQARVRAQAAKWIFWRLVIIIISWTVWRLACVRHLRSEWHSLLTSTSDVDFVSVTEVK